MDILDSYIHACLWFEENRPDQVRKNKKGCGFALKAYNGKYVTTRLSLEATKDMSKNQTVDEFSKFYIEKIDGNTIALKMDSDKYLSRFVLFFPL